MKAEMKAESNEKSKLPRSDLARRAAALLTALALLLTMALPLTVFAEDAPPDEDTARTLTLETVDDLLAFAENCRLDSWSQGLTVTLAADLNVSGTPFAGIPTFGGEFIGGGHSISGLNLTGDGSVQGFFRYVQKGATVQGLHLRGSVAPAGSKAVVGALAGSNAGTLQNCTFAGIVTGGDTVGGLVGRNETTGILNGCGNRGVCYGSHFVGGLVGDNHGVVSGCTNQMDVNTTAAQNQTNTTPDSLTLAGLTKTSNAADITDIGGVAGTSSGVLRGCTNRGTVGYQHIGYNVGGIAGSQSGYVEGCVNYGSVFARKEAGGIVGQMEPSSDLEYQPDTLQIVSGQLYTLQNLTNQAASDAEASNSALTGEIHSLQNQVSSAYSAVSTLVDATVDSFTPTTTDLSGLLGEEADWGRLDELRAAHGRPVHREPGDSVDLPTALNESDSVLAARNDLDGTMNGIFNTVNSLNANTSNSAGALVNDIRAIANQVNKIGQTLSGAGQRDEDIIQDISDEDTAQDTAGKVENCVNHGAVQADINAGGIAGAMAPENDLDPEDDVQISGESSLNFTYKTRAVLRESRNHATVTAQKRGAGGMVGEMQMGTVQNCLNLGRLDAADAEQVGGIAGASGSSIRGCAAKCDILGARQVGGIAGSGATITDCLAQVRILDAQEQYGAIAGLCEDFTTPKEDSEDPDGQNDAEDVTTVSGNYFVYESVAPLGGLDGISYADAAEGLPYAEFAALDGLPNIFAGVTLYFWAEDGSEVARYTLPYGSAFAEGDIPAVPAKTGCLGEWEGLGVAELDNLRYDENFTACYTPLCTALASTTQRGSRPLALLEGAFDRCTGELLTPFDGGALPVLSAAAPGGREPVVLESWRLTLPAAAATAAETTAPGALHYLPPDEYEGKAVIDEDVRLYLRGTDGGWRLAEATQDGSYLVVETQPGDDALCAVFAPAPNYLPWVCLAAAVLVLVILLLHRHRKRKAKKAAVSS